MTIAELKEYIVHVGIPDSAQINIAVQSHTQPFPSAYVGVVQARLDPYDDNTLRLFCTLPEGYSISKRKGSV